MTKQKIDKNYLDYIPVKNPDIEYETNEKGTITVFIRWEGFFNKIAQKFFHRPKVSSIDLDDYGSFVWGIIGDTDALFAKRLLSGESLYTVGEFFFCHLPITF